MTIPTATIATVANKFKYEVKFTLSIPAVYKLRHLNMKQTEILISTIS